MISLYSGGITNKTKSRTVTVEEIIKLISSDKYADDIARLRKAVDKSVKTIIKKNLDYVTWSGTFKERTVEGLQKHSGLICLDFDDIEEIEATKEKLSNLAFTHVCFISPSGNGLKLVVKINPEHHLESFYALEKLFKETYNLELDKSGKDVSRACFLSHDQPYFNADSLVYEIQGLPKAETRNKPKTTLKVDEETGEVLEVDERENWDKKKKQEFEKLKIVVGRVVAAEKDLTEHYEDWMNIGMSLAVFGEPARDLFHELSKINSEYKQRECDEKYTNFIKTSRFTSPAKFYVLCKDNGIDTTIKKEKAKIENDDTDWVFFEEETRTNLQLTEEQKNSVKEYRICEYENRYYFAKEFDYGNRAVEGKFMSNFVIRPLFLITSKTDPKRIIEITNVYGVTKILDIPTSAFVSLNEFNNFIESQGNFLFTDKPPFTFIKVKIYNKTLNAEEIKTLGWHKDGYYFFANGAFHKNKFIAIDEYGIVNDSEKGKNYFIPALSDIYKEHDDSFENEKKFVYQKSEINFKEWSTLFYKVFGDKGMIGMTYYITALFRDLIFDKYKFFPHLFLFGLPGSGKSSMGWRMQDLFGIAPGPFMLNAGTQVGFYRTFAQYKNGLVWFDEYANDIDQKRIQSLKGAYDGSGHIKGEYSNSGQSTKTTTTPINSACIISGQHLPISDIALFKRVILLNYSTLERTEEEKKLFEDLEIMGKKGISHITGSMMYFREEVKTKFEATMSEINKEMMEIVGNKIETRMLINYIIPMAVFKITAARLQYPFSYETLRNFMVANIREQHNMINNSKETSQFWDMIDFLLSSSFIKNEEDFRIDYKSEIRIYVDGKDTTKRLDSSKRLISIRLSKIHPLYMKFTKEQHGKTGMDRNSLVHYLTSSNNYIGYVNNQRFGKTMSSCYVFDYEILVKEGYDFERLAPIEPEANF